MGDATRQSISVNQVEAARRVGVTDRTLRRWEKRGLIRSRRVNNGVRLYPVDRLEALAKGEDHGDAE
ncbi:MAG TPA: MerR family DNA-binding transcriptional regulator [Tepidisphaeraceae bacterium]|nr:MerR family DNA-binding transcriptional regulator [Tepidisphaeraceae bacterium]